MVYKNWIGKKIIQLKRLADIKKKKKRKYKERISKQNIRTQISNKVMHDYPD